MKNVTITITVQVDDLSDVSEIEERIEDVLADKGPHSVNINVFTQTTPASE